MLLTIHNLPPRTEYSDVKELITLKCGLKESIIDNLQNEGSGMRVTVGVLEEEDAAILVRKINGIYYRGQQLYVEDKRQKKDSEQPYRTPMLQQPQVLMGYDYNSQVQATLQGMYSQSANYAMYQPQTAGQNIPNNFLAYGGQQPQLLGFNELTPQTFAPLAQQNVEQEKMYIRRSSSRDQAAEDSNRWDGGGRLGRGDKRRLPSPSGLAPWDSRGGKPSRQPPYQEIPTPRNERPERPTRFDKPQDVYEELGPRQNDDMHGYSARGSRGGVSSSSRGMRGGHSSNSRGMRGGHSSTSRDMRGDDSTSSYDMRGGHSSSSRGMRGGHSSSSNDIRDGHYSSSNDIRGGHYSSSRGMSGGYSSSSRGMRGGHSSNSYDIRGGHSSSSRGMRGGYSSNSRGMRGGHSSNSRGMRGGHSSNSRDMRGDYDRDTRDYVQDVYDDRPKFAKKRRWDESSDQFEERPDAQEQWREQPTSQRQSRPLHREYHEPRPKKFAPQNVPNKAERYPQTAPVFKNPFSAKEFRSSITRGTCRLLYIVAKNLKIEPQFEGPSPLKNALRKLISYRVADLVGTEIVDGDEIIARYRKQFPESEDFGVYTDIMQKLAENGESNPTVNQGSEAPKPQVNQEPVPKMTANTTRVAPKKEIAQLTPGKIPNYTQGSKKVHSQQKRQHKKEMQTLEASQVNGNFQRAMDEEVDLIGAIIENGFKKPETDAEKEVYPEVDQETCVDECKKLVMYHLSKRITNSGLKLVRVLGKPKPPRRADLELFLASYGCLSLKKSVKAMFYTASFDSYETVDELCSLPPVQIGEVLVSFKHMHIAPKKAPLNQKYAKVLRMQHVNSLIENSKVNLLDKDWQTVEEEEKKAKAAKKTVRKSDNAILVPPTDVANITGNEDETVTENSNVHGEAKDSKDFLHVDFKVIDEVRESDNDDTANDVSKGGQANDGNMISDDWDETGEDWKEDNGGNDKIAEDSENHEGEDDENVNEEGENNENVADESEYNENVADEGDDNENVADESEDHENDDAENDGQNIGDIDIADVDWDDVNEDDLEDY